MVVVTGQKLVSGILLRPTYGWAGCDNGHPWRDDKVCITSGKPPLPEINTQAQCGFLEDPSRGIAVTGNSFLFREEGANDFNRPNTLITKFSHPVTKPIKVDLVYKSIGKEKFVDTRFSEIIYLPEFTPDHCKLSKTAITAGQLLDNFQELSVGRFASTSRYN
ncbi:hypothetical protein CONCODRAFT_8981 [Conidiobolus coronatus NRRL 28638]|uniref:Uncharacterized protein n=1 Tax=Conidiobolus coronatus (strain ATCC 28846 / CBS 209.66 / NRRL 28638) TaxID=796925 RepID=A0A137P0Q0_CONC2|nr:hypothetical protein CONCODRAFT_8981 [Conidiobolus coronatus NRRL 28638]|eukprot:KXN68660.1 hypothetical protein CONCODRAFT_8981 [Conidiobolus coronatus NRRL 28638]